MSLSRGLPVGTSISSQWPAQPRRRARCLPRPSPPRASTLLGRSSRQPGWPGFCDRLAGAVSTVTPVSYCLEMAATTTTAIMDGKSRTAAEYIALRCL